MQKTLLLTGANRGLGLEFVQQYLAAGWRVIAIARQHADALTAAPPPSLRLLSLDVTDWHAVATLGDRLADERIDLLLNNAGRYGGDAQELGKLDAEEWLRVLAVNTIAPAMLVQALLPRLATGAVIASISSKMGSIEQNTSGGAYLYRSSKAALNAANRSLALDLRGRHTCVVLHPGWVQTDMGGASAPLTPHESVRGMRAVLERVMPADSGGFFDYDGAPLPW
ncbi:SDR family oxidoreductase [Chitiniphilus eburneus]|uniref:SDR family oxidoreductase n=1 Tax=Chitiniphilus eburneus TaxID=2571148 RepID=A0A4U0QBY4_9NEIS|nr:SDR family oxidoreductase [Chitiniphilus eburneus]TJZ78899.1 SDR family oxidoreductase [Chitiniphilus eburneus]